MLSDVKVEEAIVKKGYYIWKNPRSTDKGFNTHESSRRHLQAVHRLLRVPKSTQDISLALEKNLSNVQRQKRESLLKVISCTLSSSPRITFTWKERRQGVKRSTVTEIASRK